ncbi:MAG: anthranilate phosphoribosyltransferase [Maricaulaceae bacterium]
MIFNTDILSTLAQGERPTEAALEAALTSILGGHANDAQIAALLMGLETLGVTTQDVRAGTRVMRAHMVPVETGLDLLDIVGTGGTGLHTLSISTASMLVCAGAGAKLAKHGNRAASSLTGTADTLSALGVNLDITPAQAAHAIKTAGLGFLFAPNHHPAMRFVGPARRAMKIRTLFNLLGPLCNPAGAQRQLLGVANDRWRRPISETLRDLGSVHAWVVHGEDGLDEITTTGTTHVTELKDGKLRDFTLTPEDYGIKRVAMDDLRGGTPDVNAAALTALLDGTASAYRDIVRLNAGAALYIAGLADKVEDGIELATHSIDSGAAKSALAKLIEVTND